MGASQTDIGNNRFNQAVEACVGEAVAVAQVIAILTSTTEVSIPNISQAVVHCVRFTLELFHEVTLLTSETKVAVKLKIHTVGSVGFPALLVLDDIARFALYTFFLVGFVKFAIWDSVDLHTNGAFFFVALETLVAFGLVGIIFTAPEPPSDTFDIPQEVLSVEPFFTFDASRTEIKRVGQVTILSFYVEAISVL